MSLAEPSIEMTEELVGVVKRVDVTNFQATVHFEKRALECLSRAKVARTGGDRED